MSPEEKRSTPTAFTTAFLSIFGMQRGRELARVGKAMLEAAEAAALASDPRADALDEARWLVSGAAEELEALAEALALAERLRTVRGREAGLVAATDREGQQGAALLYGAGREVAEDLRRSAKALRAALDALPASAPEARRS